MHLLFFIAFLAKVSTQSIPRLNVSQSEVSVNKGQNAKLTCLPINLEAPLTVSWIKIKNLADEGTFKIISSGGTRVGDNRFTINNLDGYTLEIRDVDLTDAGTYQCQISTHPITYKDIKLIVTFAPKIVYTPPDIMAQEGSEVKLVCHVTGFPQPTVFWKRMDENVLPMGGYRYMGAEMVITNLQRSHRGAYICIAKSAVGRDERVVSLVMEFPPKIITEAYKLQVMSKFGSKSELECTVEATPKPNIHWTKEGIELIGPILLVEGNDIYKSELTIIKTKKEDLGAYSCVAVNNFGRDEQTIKLIDSQFNSASKFNARLIIQITTFIFVIFCFHSFETNYMLRAF